MIRQYGAHRARGGSNPLRVGIIAVVRSLRDRRVVRQVSVHTLLVHDDLGLTKGFSGYPTLPDLRFYRVSRGTRPAPALERAA